MYDEAKADNKTLWTLYSNMTSFILEYSKGKGFKKTGHAG